MDETRDTAFESMDETRDTELGRHLESVGEPDHGPEYWRDVRLAVAEAKAEAAAEARRPSFGRRLRAAFAPRRVRLALAAAAVAAVAAATLLVGLPGTPGPQPVSAAECLRKALAVPGSIQTWQADAKLKFYFPNVWQDYHAYVTRRVHVTLSADGGAREEYSAVMAGGHRLQGPATEVYLPGGELPPYYDDEGSWVVETNSPIGPPDAGGLPLIDMGLTVRALASSGVLRLGETVVDGRPAWTVTCTKGEMAGLPPSDKDWPVYTVTVDKQTWFMLGVQEEKAGRITSSISYSDIRVNEPLPDVVFAVESPPPPGVPVKTIDHGFHRVTLEEAASAPGVTPLVPGFVPGGYQLSAAAVAARAKVMIGTEEGDESYLGRHVFALRYSRGFDWLAVSTRVMREGDYTVDTDLCEGSDQPWSKLARTEIPITSGAFAGVTARIVAASTSSAPHLWAMKDGVLLTIAGAATADELLAVAESLQPYPGASPSTD